MENKAIARTLRLLSQLMELHEENPFKIKSIANAYFKIDKLPFAIKDKPIDEIDKIDGIGKSLASKIVELLQTGELEELKTIIAKTPEGVVEMLDIKGIGPKKIAIIWRVLGIESIGELYYACNENRLIEAKGFGLKTQEEIKNAIEFKLAANGRFLYAKVEAYASTLFTQISEWLVKVDHNSSLGFAGQYRRYCEIIDELDFVIGAENPETVEQELLNFTHISIIAGENAFLATNASGLKIRISVIPKENFYLEWFKQTGNAEHVEKVLKLAGNGSFSTEKDIYSRAGLAFIEPELREDFDEIELAIANKLPNLITYEDLKGSLHNHSTYSDGVHTLEEMAIYCKETLNMQYFGICDHSKTAFYAKGLNEERVFAQHKEIDALNEKLAPFKIFKGIESDILNDGSLDYSDEVLKSFDFVVASVHSNLRMDEEKATTRLLKAIENPYTTILGHPTGRLLLTRAGYPIDYKKIIDACAANKVVIEINANPLRLDLDWRWHRYALEKGVLLSINSDAHRTEGFHDMRYGIMVGRKGGLSAEKCLNAFSLVEITAYFEGKRV
ncbi:DNA polymerase/3'-5' exonuclease PolX [Pedobacter changchengzhani]|uniref:DNA polymerase/3'-5' exonuclease PolX n=1 Tax=Pedobacter changchengzhani TaxID=2529274 RepID=A0A4R5MMH7_9SPHI|nr:helix-hairpin-helix domain-containing protein [Pedobacter changchengzhani]TDG37007.1 DNA polymerase/3'-5' exonuclease PolX [Pedobacter changchengzhani]